LRADVRHIQSDTTDIKADLRATNQRLDALSQKTDERFDRLEQNIDERFDKSDARVNERFQKVDDRFERLEHKFDQLKDSLASAKIWALGLYIALSGSLLYVLAHGFKWL
jgi:predicted nuclease with TOPRIM domain